MEGMEGYSRCFYFRICETCILKLSIPVTLWGVSVTDQYCTLNHHLPGLYTEKSV